MSGRKFCKSSFALARRRARRNKKESLCTLFLLQKRFVSLLFGIFSTNSSSLEHRAFVWCRMYYSSRENTTKKEGEREMRNRRGNGMTCR